MTCNHHLVEESPWPLLTSGVMLFIPTSTVMFFNGHSVGPVMLGGLLLFVIMGFWFRDVARESSLMGFHTMNTAKGIQFGMILFIISEVCFFFSFFWAFFHSSLSPAIECGSIWPPSGISPINAFQVPLLNTSVLLLSGVSVTWAHHSLTEGRYKPFLIGLMTTIILGVYFSILQGFEYMEASFNLSDGVFGSIFYVTTGFHGVHVIVGSIFLLVGLIRGLKYHFSNNHHVGFLAAAWYWHFVDVVWLFLFVFMYWWGS